MATIAYGVKGVNEDFEFTLRVFEGESDQQWEIERPRGLKGRELLLSPVGRWEYRMFERRGFLFFFLNGPRSGAPFVIALNDVPRDYLRGPFCTAASGKGSLSPSVNEFDIPVIWSVVGPGCV
jgi:hypothetical protein